MDGSLNAVAASKYPFNQILPGFLEITVSARSCKYIRETIPLCPDIAGPCIEAWLQFLEEPDDKK